MLKFKPIVGCACSIMALAACGQKGALFLPTQAEAQNRATLPQVFNPAQLKATQSPALTSTPSALPSSSPTTAPATLPVSPAATPVR